jgi:hypothetical protein
MILLISHHTTEELAVSYTEFRIPHQIKFKGDEFSVLQVILLLIPPQMKLCAHHRILFCVPPQMKDCTDQVNMLLSSPQTIDEVENQAPLGLSVISMVLSIPHQIKSHHASLLQSASPTRFHRHHHINE